MKEFVVYTILTLVLIAIAVMQSGCASKHVMKNCKQMKAEGFEEYSVCEKQYKVWN